MCIRRAKHSEHYKRFRIVRENDEHSMSLYKSLQMVRGPAPSMAKTGAGKSTWMSNGREKSL